MLRPFAGGCLLLVLILSPESIQAATAQIDVNASHSRIFGTAKRYLLNHHMGNHVSAADFIHLEDRTAGILRFTFREEGFADRDAVIEVIDFGPSRCRLRVKIPRDYEGRAQLLLERITNDVKQIDDDKSGRMIPYASTQVFRSIKRHVLNRYVRVQERKEKVILLEEEDVGLIKFVKGSAGSHHQIAIVEIMPLSEQSSRLRVSLPEDTQANKILMENDLVRAIEEDLGSGSQTRSPRRP